MTGMDVVIDCLTEFFEVAIHGILYSRQIYPNGIFGKRQKYGVPVQMCVHPELNDYIRKCLLSMKPLFEGNAVQAVVVRFYDVSCRPIEAFVFEMNDLSDTLTTCENLLIAQQVLRAFCLKINNCHNQLKPLPKGCTFVIQLHVDAHHTHDLSQDGMYSEDFPWITSTESERMSTGTSEIIPLKSATTALFKLQLTVKRREFAE